MVLSQCPERRASRTLDGHPITPSRVGDEKSSARKMHDDIASPLVAPADGDMLRRKRDDLTDHGNLSVIVRRDRHLVARFAAIWIVGVGETGELRRRGA